MSVLPERVHVAVAAIINRDGEVLISKRHDHMHQGGLWEFPGGKLVHGETVQSGLCRELMEELGVTPLKMRPLIRISHDYPDKSVLLDVWRVDEISNQPSGREGQTIKWVSLASLTEYSFPAANYPIISALTLPLYYPITAAPGCNRKEFLSALDRTLACGYPLLQFRACDLSVEDYRALLPAVLRRCKRAGTRLLLNADAALAEEYGAAGVHLTSKRLMALSARPLGERYLVAASCHNREQLQQAARLGLDFAVLSPVLPTNSHPGAELLGFAGLQALAEQATLPVYALGGMRPDHLEAAIQSGAQGIAAISSLWGTDRSVTVD